ncbi:Myosin 10A, isoform D [Clydaea vesicula]|uniref:Myosin 10A, isoform D n=1 Tax=Clydaea vesicula TaxID=447962 RepID=A0AAD5U6V1_9FUNG|nr:Myosin 10A, isoform D [Clydaea vesicula]
MSSSSLSHSRKNSTQYQSLNCVIPNSAQNTSLAKPALSGGDSPLEHSENNKRLKLLVTNWFLQVCLKGKVNLDGVKDLTMLFNALRDGVLLCNLLNVLNPNSISGINLATGTMPGLENLTKFAGSAVSSYGVDRKYMFRPLDFINGTVKGEEGMIIFLAALAILATEKGYIVGNFQVSEARELLGSGFSESHSTLNLSLSNHKSNTVTNQSLSSINTVVENTQQNNLKKLASTPVSHSRENSLNSSSPTSREPSIIPRNRTLSSNSNSSPLNNVQNAPVDYSTLIPKVLEKLEILELNQKRIYNRMDYLNKNQQQRFSEIFKQNYESIKKKVSNLELTQMELQQFLLENFLVEFGFNFEMDQDELFCPQKSLLKSLEEVKRESSNLTMNPPATQVSPLSKSFNKLPPEVLSANLGKPELMRLSVVYEMIETEGDFFRDLNVMITFHKVQLKCNKMMSDEDVEILFSNVAELVSVSQNFFNKMNERKNSNLFIEEIGDIIVDATESLKAYSIYCGNYPTAMQMVQTLQSSPEIKEKVQKWMSAPECRGLSLESFLIKPIQRICKYPLLLKELLRHTEKTHKDHPNLLIAAEKIEAVVKVANEATRLLGERDRIISLQGKLDAVPPLIIQDKKLYKDGQTQFSKQNNRPREKYVILCGEFLVVSKITEKKRYQLENLFYVYDLILKPIDVKNKLVLSFFNNGTANDKKEVLSFHLNSDEEKLKWSEAFAEAMKQHPADSGLKRMTTNGSQLEADISMMGLGASELLIQEDPEMVEIEGHYWKRALAATGQNYYFDIETKDTKWKLPDQFTVVDPVTKKPVKSVEEEINNQEEEEEDDDTDTIVETINQNWKRVLKRNSMELNNNGNAKKVEVYYFNTTTNESFWKLPNDVVLPLNLTPIEL